MMRVLFVLCCIAAASAAVTEPSVLLKLSLLIGGPKLLRVHSQLFVDSGSGINGWDFVPKDATAPATLARLVTPRAAPATRGVSWPATAWACTRRGRSVVGCVASVSGAPEASRRWRGGRRDDSARTRRKILISTQVAGGHRRRPRRAADGPTPSVEQLLEPHDRRRGRGAGTDRGGAVRALVGAVINRRPWRP